MNELKYDLSDFRIKLINVIHLKDIAGSVSWSDDGKIFATSEKFGTLIRLFSTVNWRELANIDKKSVGSYSIIFMKNSHTILFSPYVVSGERYALAFFDVDSGQIVRRIEVPANLRKGFLSDFPTQNLVFNEDGSRLFVEFFPNSASDRGIYVYDTQSWDVVARINPPNGMFHLAYWARNHVLATTDAYGYVNLFNALNGDAVKKFPTNGLIGSISIDSSTCRVLTAELSQGSYLDKDSKKSISLGNPDSIRIWNLENGNIISSSLAYSSIQDAIFSPNGQIVAALSGDGSFDIYRSDNMKPIYEARDFKKGYVGGLSFSADGKELAVSGDEKVFIYSIEYNQ